MFEISYSQYKLLDFIKNNPDSGYKDFENHINNNLVDFPLLTQFKTSYRYIDSLISDLRLNNLIKANYDKNNKLIFKITENGIREMENYRTEIINSDKAIKNSSEANKLSKKSLKISKYALIISIVSFIINIMLSILFQLLL